MPDLTMSDVKAILQSGDLTNLCGKTETDWLECKGEPYPVHKDHGKRELAKDVTSFANRSGGLILIGVRTEKDLAHFGDTIADVRPMDRQRIQEGQYRNVVREWIFPEPEGLQISWYPAESSNKGVFLLEIPKQPEERKPFLIRRTLDEKKTVEILFGLAERRKADSQPHSIEHIHSLVRTGMDYRSTVDRRFTELESQIQAVLAKLAPGGTSSCQLDTQEFLTRALNDARKSAGLLDAKFAYLCALPEPTPEVTGIFESRPDGIRDLFENPPTLRSGGWDLNTGQPSQIVKGELLRTYVSGHGVLELHKNGAALFSIKMDEDSLCWRSRGGRIHPLALIETVFNFLNFCRGTLPFMKPPPVQIHFLWGMQNLQKDPANYLVPYGVRSIQYSSGMGGKGAPDNSFERELGVPVSDFLPERTGYDVVKEIYLWFGLEEKKIPYVQRQGGSALIDLEQLKLP